MKGRPNGKMRGPGACRAAWVLAALLSAAGAATADPCISISSNGYEAGGTDLGVATVQWRAELTNQCNASYDADLEIRFVDGDSKVVYQSRDLISVPRHGSAAAHREFNIPAPDFERVQDVLVKVVAERERPF